MTYQLDPMPLHRRPGLLRHQRFQFVLAAFLQSRRRGRARFAAVARMAHQFRAALRPESGNGRWLALQGIVLIYSEPFALTRKSA